MGNDPLLQRKDFSKRIRRLKRKCNLLFCAKDIVGFSKMRHCITSLLHQIFLKRLFNFNPEKCTHFWAKYWSLADSNHKVWTVLIIVRTDSFKFPCLNCPFLHANGIFYSKEYLHLQILESCQGVRCVNKTQHFIFLQDL